eukprot:g5459.t1
MRRTSSIARVGLAPRASRVVSAPTLHNSGSCGSPIPLPAPGVYKLPPTTELWRNSGRTRDDASTVHTVASEAELVQLLTSIKPNSLVVLNFCAALCKTSKAAEAKFEETAIKFGESSEDEAGVHFAKVKLENNGQVFEKLGLRSVPHVQIFSGYSGKVADFSLSNLKNNALDSLLADRRDSMLA